MSLSIWPVGLHTEDMYNNYPTPQTRSPQAIAQANLRKAMGPGYQVALKNESLMTKAFAS